MKTEHTHDHIQEKIIAHFYMDDELSADDLAEIKSCETCTDYFKQIKKMAETNIVNEPDDHYWDHYYDRLEARYEKEKHAPIIHLFHRIKPQAVAVAAVVILIFGFWLGKFIYQPVKTDDLIANIDAMEIETLITRSKVLFTQFNQLDEFNARFHLDEHVNQSKDLLRLASYLREKHAANPTFKRFFGDLEKVFIQMQSIEEEDIFLIRSIQNNLFQGHVLAKLESINM